MANSQPDPFELQFRGRFQGILRWEQLDQLWNSVTGHPHKHWYLYAVGEPPPLQPATKAELDRFVAGIDELLRREHREEYCGIVYVDDPDDPHFIKVFDPGNLGVVCGYSDNPPLPGWILTVTPPTDLRALPPPQGRRRWWQGLLPRRA